MCGKTAKNRVDSRLVTDGICALCYSFEDVLLETEIKKSHDIGGKNPLLVCRDCFNSKIKIPTSSGSSNVRENKQQKLAPKKRKLDVAVQNGLRKARKS